MEREIADEMMWRCLVEAGFDTARPDPRLAWSAFKRFVVQHVPRVHTVTVGYECNPLADLDEILWLSFMRRVEEPRGLGWSCGCLLSIQVPTELSGITDSYWWWSEHGTLAEWQSMVESRAVFQRCLALGPWRWEGLSE
ncbi:MAG: hypothetical protein C5B58_06435 [Acidobacteria bacterium]|nr:MAG: hypothetical protein C5B58_06435 [Acidobacteriota bacterium]